ncbi:PD-(D/E)XK motif protein [Burkholderia cenocepacia]|uniref:PD-(D/E)XK motif protein n=1 Tax=Burkholderia cenocepacia TaxID=95486 RepID=UPI002856F0C7|nr:PD-(D/E)XK motif protein [Burkholderia cenocepacia]MDR5660171.1 PD-(D/E)XK motif protein [Burkholderia cenocepacia]MDR8093330.1 PD-(D/E)XK motif protein [Burkholderia cenocepacia]
MSESSPWDGIGVPGTDFNVRQVMGKMAVPCFWGRDRSGACLFIVELQGDHSVKHRTDAVTVHGIDVDLRTGDVGRQCLVLTLEKEVDRDLFEGLCRTLASALEHATDSTSSLAIALAHIRRWKTFLSGRGQYLSAQQAQGLFAELAFLLELLDRSVPAVAALEAWLGPDKSHQDFIFGNSAVEIKSISGIERSTVRISSEDQLESLTDALFLRIYRLSNLPDAAGARSLNATVEAVQARLGEAEAVEAFDRKLVAYGYAPLPNYDQPTFVISDIATYRVQDGFPRLIRSQMSTGIEKVTYDIRLEAIAPYECNGAAVFGGS